MQSGGRRQATPLHKYSDEVGGVDDDDKVAGVDVGGVGDFAFSAEEIGSFDGDVAETAPPVLRAIEHRVLPGQDQLAGRGGNDPHATTAAASPGAT